MPISSVNMVDDVSPVLCRPAVFLDRDDTLNHNRTLPKEAFPQTPGDLYLPAYVRLIAGAAEACQTLRSAGYVLVIVTNQASHARGHASLREIEATNARVCELLGTDGGGRPLIEAVYSAPHHPGVPADASAGACSRPHLASAHPWRKPGPGMLLAAARELGLDLVQSWIIGDKERDCEAGLAAGLRPDRCVRVAPPSRDGDDLADPLFAAADFEDLAAAAAHIVNECRRFGQTEGAVNQTRAAPILTQPTTQPTSMSGQQAIEAISPATTVTLRAHTGRPLANPEVARNVRAAAEAIAERTGVRLLTLAVEPDAVCATIATHRLAAMGFLAELRRLTNQWHAARTDGSILWPRVVGDDEVDRDSGEGDDDQPWSPGMEQ